MNYQIDDEQPGTSAGTDSRKEELFESFRPAKVFSDRTVRELKRVQPCHQCLVCGYVASCKSNLVIHSRAHTGERPFSCELCNQKFSLKCNLTKHLLAHKDIRQFQCSECNYKAYTKHNLVVHLLQHSGAKPHQCDVCDYSAARKETLTRHKRTHSEDKPYSCSVCTYKAKQSASLNFHTKKHTGCPFVCSECDYQSAKKSDLDRHMLTHTGQRPLAFHVHIVPTGLGKRATLPDTQRFVNMPQSQQYELGFRQQFLLNLVGNLFIKHSILA